MPEQPCLGERVHAVHHRKREPVRDDHPPRRVPEPAMAAAVRALSLGPTGHRSGPPQALTARHRGDLRPVPREHRRIGDRCRDRREAGVIQPPNRHPLPRSRSRVASRTLTVSPHHSTASLRDRPSRSVNSRSASPARFSVSITAWSRSPIATMTRSARSITRRTRSSRSRRRFSAIPRRTPRLLLDRLLTHLVLTRVDMDSDSHLRHFPGPRAITEPQKPSNPLPRPSQSSRSEPDAPAVTDTPLRPPKFPRPTKCHTPLASSDPRVFRLCETTVSPQSPGAFYGRP
jgi:hypothetical protein